MKKVLCLLFVVLCTFTLVPNVHAVPEYENINQDSISVITSDVVNTIQEMLGSIRMEADSYGLQKIDFLKLKIGTEIPAYNSYSERIINIRYFPIFEGSRIVAIATIHADNFENPQITIGVDFGPKLQLLIENNNNYALLFEGDSLYAITPNKKALLHVFPGLVDKHLTSPIESSIVYSKSEPLISLVVNSTSILSTSKYLSVPIKLQGDYPICWAASIASIGQYKTGINKTAKEVCDDAGTGYIGLSMIYCRDVLIDQYSLNNVIRWYPPTKAKIVNDINNYNPIFAGFYKWNMGHAVVFRGYYEYSPTNFMISYMDPNYSTFKAISVTTDQDYSIVYGSDILNCKEYIELTY